MTTSDFIVTLMKRCKLYDNYGGGNVNIALHERQNSDRVVNGSSDLSYSNVNVALGGMIDTNSANRYAIALEDKLSKDGCDEFKDKYLSGKFNVKEFNEFIVDKYKDLPESFLLKCAYLKSAESLLFTFYVEYLKYSNIYTIDEYKALYYAKDIIHKESSLTDEKSIRKYISQQPCQIISNIEQHGFGIEEQAAVMLLIHQKRIIPSLLFVRIPGVCKNALIDGGITVTPIILRLHNYNNNRYSSAKVDENGKIILIALNEKLYTPSVFKRLLISKYPRALLNASGSKGLYVDVDNELREYIPCERE